MSGSLSTEGCYWSLGKFAGLAVGVWEFISRYRRQPLALHGQAVGEGG